MGGQLLSGINVKNSVGITAFAEAITCFIGFTVYLLSGRTIYWGLTVMLIISALLAVPCAALTVKNAYSDNLKRFVAILMMILGLCTLLKIGVGG